jgi:hypothetical protein
MKTALDFFIEKITLKKTETDIYLYPRISFEDVLKAKEMERQQIIDARLTAPVLFVENYNDYRVEAEDYYNKTFKSINNG